MFKILFVLIIIIWVAPVNTALADITSKLICPCECAMVISSCECPTAIRIKNEITQMKDNGFSEKQTLSVLQAEYGTDIQAHPEKINSASLWVAGASVSILLIFLGYIFTKRTKIETIPDIKK